MAGSTPGQPSPSTPSASASVTPTGPVLPAGELIAFHSDPGGRDDTYVMKPSGRGVVALTDGMETIAAPTWSPDGTRLAVECCTFDFGHIFVLGTDGLGWVEVAAGVSGAERPSWSPDSGRLAFESTEDRSIFVVDVTGSSPGSPVRVVTDGAGPTWSPDGSHLAYFRPDQSHQDIYSIPLTGGPPVRLTDASGPDYSPLWSPDGSTIAFVSERDGNSEIYAMDPDGRNQRDLSMDPAPDDFPAWSPDGSTIAYVSYRNGADPFMIGNGNAEVFVVGKSGMGKRNLTRSRAWEGDPAWAPDGRHIVFTRRAGSGELFVMRPDGTDVRHLVGLTGGGNDCCAVWRPT